MKGFVNVGVILHITGNSHTICRSINIGFPFYTFARFILAYGTWLTFPPGNQFRLAFVVLKISLNDIPSPLDTREEDAKPRYLILFFSPRHIERCDAYAVGITYRVVGAAQRYIQNSATGQHRFYTERPDNACVESSSRTSKVSSIQSLSLASNNSLAYTLRAVSLECCTSKLGFA